MWPEEMIPLLKALAALPEAPASVPRTHTVAHGCNFSSLGSTGLCIHALKHTHK